jgi:riboflavin kinase/FMN adenylyltransferase
MDSKERVLALGFFDGIHIGHSALLKKVLEVSTDKKLVASVITFDSHPQNLITETFTPLINSMEDRTGLINRIFGIDDIIYLHFDKDTANMTWDEFIDRLVSKFGARHLVAGHDYKFGSGGKGNSELLAAKCLNMGIGCDIIPEVKLDGVTCSSTYIRSLITSGDMERANAFLGHPHVLTDIVRYGYRLGRSLGTPTVNMKFGDDVLIPAFGVYASKVILDDGSVHYGVTNIGVKPTIDNIDRLVTAETYILDFMGNLYGRSVRIEFYKHLRKEIKFNNIDELKAQILRDCETTLEYFAANKIIN